MGQRVADPLAVATARHFKKARSFATSPPAVWSLDVAARDHRDNQYSKARNSKLVIPLSEYAENNPADSHINYCNAKALVISESRQCQMQMQWTAQKRLVAH
jgi:hypothetical protein